MRRRFEELMRQRHDLNNCVLVPTEAAIGIASEAGEYFQLLRKWRYEDDLMHINYLKMRAKNEGLGEEFDRMMEQYRFGFLDSLLEDIEHALEV